MYFLYFVLFNWFVRGSLVRELYGSAFLVCLTDIFPEMPYLTTYNAIIDCENSIILFPKKGITLTCRKGNNARFSAMTNSDTPDFISEFPDVFPAKKITELLPLHQINHHLNLIKGKIAPSSKMFTVPDKILPAYRQIIEDGKAKNIIYPCDANNPVNMFPKLKPNAKIGLLADLVPRNDITIKNNSTIPNQSMILRTVARAKYWSTIDLSNWYFQIRVAPEDETLNSIKTPFGTFACQIMLQGDTNSPSTAMRVMEYVLDGLLGKTVWAYLDDITIFSDSFENYVRDIRQVCQILQDHHITAFPSKCNFFADRLPLLGHVINNQGINADPEKIWGIQDWHTPKSKNELETFIGVVIYHAQFLLHLATARAPLSDLLSQNEFEWRPLHEEAFQQVKHLAKNITTLRPIEYQSHHPIYLFTDASKVGAGAWIAQGPSPEKAHPAVFHSRKFATSQLHYPVHQLELLAIVDAVQSFHPMLYGTSFTVVTDNKALSFFLSQTNPPYHQTRGRMFLQSYDFDIIHQPGKDNVLADALSRIYEEREASADLILVDPTEKKAIKGPYSAMTSSVKHNLRLAHTLDPIKEPSFFSPTPLDPFSLPQHLSMWNVEDVPIPGSPKEKENDHHPGPFEQGLYNIRVMSERGPRWSWTLLVHQGGLGSPWSTWSTPIHSDPHFWKFYWKCGPGWIRVDQENQGNDNPPWWTRTGFYILLMKMATPLEEGIDTMESNKASTQGQPHDSTENHDSHSSYSDTACCTCVENSQPFKPDGTIFTP